MKKQRIAAILLAGLMTCSMMGGSTVLASSETEMTSETETADEAQEPLVIADQGIFSAGGVTITSDGTFNLKTSGKRAAPDRRLMWITRMSSTRSRKRKQGYPWYFSTDMDSHVWAG